MAGNGDRGGTLKGNVKQWKENVMEKEEMWSEIRGNISKGEKIKSRKEMLMEKRMCW